jgi:hypothetical protein
MRLPETGATAGLTVVRNRRLPDVCERPALRGDLRRERGSDLPVWSITRAKRAGRSRPWRHPTIALLATAPGQTGPDGDTAGLACLSLLSE